MAGGRDLLAGGTWLAVSRDGRVCAVTNRRVPGTDEVQRDPDRRSRGDIPVHVLTAVGEDSLPAYLGSLGPGRYNPVNVLYVSRALAMVASVDDTGPPRVRTLQPGLHVLTVDDVDADDRPKVAMLSQRLRTLHGEHPDAEALETALRALLSVGRSPTDDARDAPCIHGDVYGTVSSSSVIARDGGLVYRHAAGRPCVSPFALVRALEAGRR